MPTRLGISGEGQDSGREGEHTVRSGFRSCLFDYVEICLVYVTCWRREAWMKMYLFTLCLSPICVNICESVISTLCDNLRRERDRAVSDLADALRNLDDTRKQKNDAARELKELK